MYGHPHNPDPWAEVQEIPPYSPVPVEHDHPEIIVGCMAVALPVAALFFAAGYFVGVWGWL